MIPARDNPFASHRVEALKYRFPGFSLDQSLIRLAEHDWRGAIVGPHGAGKTTLLIELHAILQKRFAGQRSLQFWFVPRDKAQQSHDWQRLSQSVDSTEILLVDGIERLSWLVRGQLQGLFPWGVGDPRRITRSIIVTTHRPLLGLPIWLRCATSQAILCELLLELYPTAPPSLVEQAHRLFRQCGGNIRDVLWRLYDQVADSKL
jgi:hypothetical protein